MGRIAGIQCDVENVRRSRCQHTGGFSKAPSADIVHDGEACGFAAGMGQMEAGRLAIFGNAGERESANVVGYLFPRARQHGVKIERVRLCGASRRERQRKETRSDSHGSLVRWAVRAAGAGQRDITPRLEQGVRHRFGISHVGVPAPHMLFRTWPTTRFHQVASSTKVVRNRRVALPSLSGTVCQKCQ